MIVSPTVLLILFASQSFVQFVSGQNCVYTDANTGAVLYLDALENAMLTYTADALQDRHTYQYTPCRNAAGVCPSGGGTETAMVRQTLDSDPSVCTVIANWDSSVQPTFDPVSSNGTWKFEYQNGDNIGCAAPRSFTAYYICDMQAGDYMIESAGEIAACSYAMWIKSKWACPQYPIYCKWTANNGNNTLDLSNFDNGTIVAPSDSNDNLYYRYSPCRNGLKCNVTSDMIDLYNIVTLECKQYLALWQDTTHPSVNYNSVDKSWQFIYMNGEKCNGYQSITTVIWKCNPSVSYRVVTADTIAPCQNLLEFESNVACN